MKTFSINTVFFTVIALTSASASASLADRYSDQEQIGSAASNPYSGQTVIRGKVAMDDRAGSPQNPYSGQVVVRGQIISAPSS